MSLLAFKLVAAAVVLLCGLVAGLLPLRLAHSAERRRFFGLANAMAGGVFLGAALIHMLPDGTEALAGFGLDYPVAGLLAGVGFSLVLLLEHGLMGGQEEAAIATRATGKSLYPFILLLVLSLHSLIAGACLGLETTAAATTAILLAVVAHKGSAAFALGVSMAQGGVPTGRATRLMLLFSLSTPVGIVLGAAAGAWLQGRQALLVEGVFDGLAAGTFLYVAILDILAEEFEQPESRWAKVILVGAGLGVMALVAVWA